MVVINLEKPNSLPQVFIDELGKCNRHFERDRYLENLTKVPAIFRLVEEINRFCTENMVLGFHYTRAFRDDLLAQGLRVRSGEEIRSEFMSRFGSIFTAAERKAIETAWADYFTPQMKNGRDGRIFFNFTTEALANGGADLLLNNYGGEQVYFCIDDLPGVAEKIKSLGEPFIVKCTLIPEHLQTFIDRPWGNILVSSYHRMVNPDSHQIDQDGSQSIPVLPERIELIPYEH